MQLDTPERPDVDAIMSRIRGEVKEFLKDKPVAVRSYVPEEAKFRKDPASPVLYSESLNYLNANWQNWATAGEITSHRPFIGPLIVSAKKFLVNVIWKYVLKGYFEREREFQMKLVSFLNETARYIDARDSEIFWQLIEKIDNDIRGAGERAAKLVDQVQATLTSIEMTLQKRLSQLENDRALLTEIAESSHNEIVRLDELLRSLETTVAHLSQSLPGETQFSYVSPQIISAEQRSFSSSIAAFVLQSRVLGSEAELKTRFRGYLPIFESVPGVVIELGCGRGEFLELLRESGKDAFGVDSSEQMIHVCQEKGLHVTQIDPLVYLEQLPEKSIGGIFASRLIERLTAPELDRLLSLVKDKVVVGGRVVLETLNPQSVTAMSRNFFRDPANHRPIHPETLEFLLAGKGIRVERLTMGSPYAASVMLQPVEVSEALPLRWKEMLGQLNDNIKRLNDLLFGYQDYSIVGLVEELPEHLRPLNGEPLRRLPQSRRQSRMSDDVYEV